MFVALWPLMSLPKDTLVPKKNSQHSICVCNILIPVLTKQTVKQNGRIKIAAYSELNIEQYATFSTTVNVEDSAGTAINLFGYSAASQIRKSYYSSSSNNFTATITGNANGEITLSMTAANTANLTPGRALYDLVITAPNGTKTRVVEGIVNVLGGVTQ